MIKLPEAIGTDSKTPRAVYDTLHAFAAYRQFWKVTHPDFVPTDNSVQETFFSMLASAGGTFSDFDYLVEMGYCTVEADRDWFIWALGDLAEERLESEAL